MYDSLEEWISHMKIQHARHGWTCMEQGHESSVSFDDEGLFRQHMAEEHNGEFVLEELDTIVEECYGRLPAAELLDHCPFCNDFQVCEQQFRAIEEHIAVHLLSLAQISLAGHDIVAERGSEPGSLSLTDVSGSSNTPLSISSDPSGNDDDLAIALPDHSMDELPDEHEENWQSYWNKRPRSVYDPFKDPIIQQLQSRTTLTTTGDNEDSISLEMQLRSSQIKHEDGSNFFSARDISKILSREKIERELERHQLSEEISVDVIRSNEPEMEPSQPQKGQTHLRVFALLLLLGREDEIIQFVKDGVCDGILPVVPRQTTKHDLCLRSAPDKPLGCFKKWKAHEREYFDNWQYRVSVPFFAPQRGPGSNEMTAPHYTFDTRTVLPWCARDTKAPSSYSRPFDEASGGYSTVRRVRMDPQCHGFQEILEKVRETTESRLDEFTRLSHMLKC